MPEFEETITHGQINVFDLSEPDFNLWTDDHVAQGFSWRPGNVSFGVPDHDGTVLVDVERADAVPALADDVLRMIRVPLEIRQGAVVATITSEHEIDMPHGAYAVVFALRPGFAREGAEDWPVAYRIAITFVPDASGTFAILRRDGEMTTDAVLTTTAEPAI